MTLQELADIFSVEIHTYYSNYTKKFHTKLRRLEIKDRGFLVSSAGYGDSKKTSMEDYCNRVRGRILVKNAHSDSRMEIQVPETLVAE
jgi:hypothetical protein